MASSQGKHNMPKDTQIIVSMMKDLGITDFDQQVLNHFLEFNYRYTTLLLDDAKTYSKFAKKKNVDVDDVKVAIHLAQDGVFFRPPPREVLTKAAGDINKLALPIAKPASDLRIPHDRSNFSQTNYKLRTDLYSNRNACKSDNKTTAAELLEEARKMPMDDRVFTPSDQIMNNTMDFNLQEFIENQQSIQENTRENGKDDLMETSFENRSYSDMVLDDSIEKKP